jgi:hypothetical protein
MTNEQIEKITQVKESAGDLFEINFRVRSAVKGVFIRTNDYAELSRKNLWRIVNEVNVEEYKKTKNENLTRIFNGVDFTRLKPVTK